jgi:hypothetical protein
MSFSRVPSLDGSNVGGDYEYLTPSIQTRGRSKSLTGIGADGDKVKKEVNKLKRSFMWFSLVASINHALNYVVTSYATTLLPGELGGTILGLSWILNSVSGLTFATPVVRRCGFKHAMIISFWGYTFQIATLYIAVVSAPNIGVPFAVLGSVIAGFTSAVWWTAQGVCFELTCAEIHDCQRVGLGAVQDLNEIRANLSASWTLIYQVTTALTLDVFDGTRLLVAIR